MSETAAASPEAAADAGLRAALGLMTTTEGA